MNIIILYLLEADIYIIIFAMQNDILNPLTFNLR